MSLLPYKEKIIHVRWSGEGCWIPLGDLDLGLPYENHTSHPALGQIILYPGGISETEILLAYGGVCFASKVGQLAGNHFLTVTKGAGKSLCSRQAHASAGRSGHRVLSIRKAPVRRVALRRERLRSIETSDWERGPLSRGLWGPRAFPIIDPSCGPGNWRRHTN